MSITAQRLSQAMADRQVDQTGLARAIGATQGAIAKILSGKTANSRLLPRIAGELGVPLGWLLGGEGQGAPAPAAPLHAQDRELLDVLRRLPPAYRAALLHLSRVIAEM